MAMPLLQALWIHSAENAVAMLLLQAPGTVDTFCRECCVNAPAVGLDVLVAGVVAGDRESKSIWKCDGSA